MEIENKEVQNSTKKVAFDQRTPEEIEVANKIREKNKLIATEQNNINNIPKKRELIVNPNKRGYVSVSVLTFVSIMTVCTMTMLTYLITH